MRCRFGRVSPLVSELMICVAVVIAALAFYYTRGFGLLRVYEKESLGDYQWGELKAIAVMISNADSDEEAIQIAQRFGLCDENGRIDFANTKTVAFGDGSEKMEARILGFRQDVQDNGRLAGITFCFCGSLDSVPMYGKLESRSSVSGWEESSARTKLASYVGSPPLVTDKIDVTLGKVMATVQKKSVGYSITDKCIIREESTERVFPLSFSEIYGTSNNRYSASDSDSSLDEGDQYQFFREVAPRDISEYFDLPNGGVWLRTHAAAHADSFLTITERGLIKSKRATSKRGIVAAFCL